jgi:hypothetical protein
MREPDRLDYMHRAALAACAATPRVEINRRNMWNWRYRAKGSDGTLSRGSGVFGFGEKGWFVGPMRDEMSVLGRRQ